MRYRVTEPIGPLKSGAGSWGVRSQRRAPICLIGNGQLYIENLEKCHRHLLAGDGLVRVTRAEGGLQQLKKIGTCAVAGAVPIDGLLPWDVKHVDFMPLR